MVKSEKSIVPGSPRHLMQQTMEKDVPQEPSLQQRVTKLETFKEQLGSVTELKSRIDNIEHMLFSPTPSTNIRKI